MTEGTGEPNQLSTDQLAKLHAWLTQQVTQEYEGSLAAEATQEGIRQRLADAYIKSGIQLSLTLKDELFSDILNDLLGYGAIQPLLDDPQVSEIMINNPNHVFVERQGRLEQTGIKFDNDAALLRLIDRIIMPLGRHIDADNPTVDARLPDGSRVNAVIRPVAIDGPSITIRKFSKRRLRIGDLIGFDTLTENMAEFLKACVAARINIVVSGGTGSGKTTLLNILSEFIPEGERIVTIEDAAELQLNHLNIVRLETKAPNVEGKGAVTVRYLVRNALRMRPDRIIVGEVRGGEALDMLQAMNTGHYGSLTTVHANTPRDAISRLETLRLVSGVELPLRVVRKQIASAVDLIVQQTRLRDGSRKVTAISEVIGMDGDVVVMSDLFSYKDTGITENGKVIGMFRATGFRPMFGGRLEAAGYHLKPEIYGADTITLRRAGGQSR